MPAGAGLGAASQAAHQANPAEPLAGDAALLNAVQAAHLSLWVEDEEAHLPLVTR